jgi:hypothetical protein
LTDEGNPLMDEQGPGVSPGATQHERKHLMIRKFKGVTLALVAVLAMSAFVASAAQAITIQSTSYPQTVTGEGKGIGKHFKTEAGSVECEISNFDGTLSEASSTLTVKPTYSGCTAFFGFAAATIHTEECAYVFHATGHDAGTATFTANVDVSCPGSQSIKITAGTCRAEVKSQTGLSTVNITGMSENTGGGVIHHDLTVKPIVSKIAYTVTQDGFGCPFGGTGNKTGGEYTSTGYTTVASNSGLTILT